MLMLIFHLICNFILSSIHRFQCQQQLKQTTRNKKYKLESPMLPAQGINLISKASPLSVVKINYLSNSPQSSTKIPNPTPAQLHSALSPDLKINLSLCSSPRLNKSAQNWNSFNKFFKKQIQMHERELKKNPRIKLIQNTRKVISNQNPACDKYILHSTKRLKIISENMHSERSHQDRSITVGHTSPIPHLISLSEQNQQADQRMADSMDDKRRKLSQEGKRIFKGITSRRGNRLGRFSLELEKYKSTEQQNQEDFVQHKKINLYQSLIYSGHLKTHNLAMPVTESLGGDYSRIDRSKSPPTEEIFGKKTREGLRQYVVSGFPAKKVEKSEPQVLTIHIKRPQNKFRSSLVSRQEKGSHYHPRPITISNINIFKRPNTTLVNGRNRRDSEIEPW